ncbi:MAG: hypothetical protein ACR2L1_10485 [Pyrinomonadaceae bacterium]
MAHQSLMIMKSAAIESNSKSHLSITSKDGLIIQSIAKIDCTALGIAAGFWFGLCIFLATNFLVFKGGQRIGPTFVLLNQYFIGYEVTFAGSLIGLLYGLITGFVIGWLIAFLRNSIIKIYLHFIKFKNRIASIGGFLDS